MLKKSVLTLLILANLIIVGKSQLPVNTGFLVYHSYSSYDAWDSKMFLLNFENSELEEISKNWNIDHAMNGHISPDGRKLVFMGDDKGEPRDWDVYLWEIGSDEQPVNLTHGYNKRDEDPKFSPDGTKIVIKQSYWSSAVGGFVFDIKEIDLVGNIINTVTSYDQIEESMPYYTADGSSIVYASSGGADGDIEKINIDGSDKTIIENAANIQEYYPIVRDNDTYFFTRWVSGSDHHDQVYIGHFNGDPAESAAFNQISSDNSDAYPADGDRAFFSSTRSGGKGAYDLYLGNISSGETWSFDNVIAVNSWKNELGACYNPNSITSSAGLSEAPEFTLYPNPSYDGMFFIDSDMPYSVRVVDVQGKLIMDRKEKGFASIDLSGKGNGIYFIILQTDYDVKTMLLISD